MVTLLTFILISVAVIEPYLRSETGFFQDGNLRKSLAGKIDTIAIGASHAQLGINTALMDEKLQCFGYNLSGQMMTLSNRYHMLQKELERNPVDTVILELSFDTLTRNEKEEFAMGDDHTVVRMDSSGERISYMLRYMPVDDWLNLYSRTFVMGMVRYYNILKGDTASAVNYVQKGFLPKPAKDVSLVPSQVAAVRSNTRIDTDYRQENIEKFTAIINLCKEYDAQVIVVVVPLSHAKIWQYDGWDDFYNWARAYCREQQCDFYDFNLLTDRYDLLQDATSFEDEEHLSETGAYAFTESMCGILNRAEAGEDVASFFYDSYEEMKEDSLYMQYLS